MNTDFCARASTHNVSHQILSLTEDIPTKGQDSGPLEDKVGLDVTIQMMARCPVPFYIQADPTILGIE